MNCSVCKVGKMTDSLDKYVERVMLRGFVIIKNVPCKKCNMCGKILFSDSVMKKIENLIDDAKEKAEKFFEDEETFWEWTIEFE